MVEAVPHISSVLFLFFKYLGFKKNNVIFVVKYSLFLKE
jgi:hypothetical protein